VAAGQRDQRISGDKWNPGYPAVSGDLPHLKKDKYFPPLPINPITRREYDNFFQKGVDNGAESWYSLDSQKTE
jgi:hypothetical protein